MKDICYFDILRNVVEKNIDRLNDEEKERFMGMVIEGENNDHVDKCIKDFLSTLSAEQSVDMAEVSLEGVDPDDLWFLVQAE